MLTPIKTLALSKAVNGQLRAAREKVRPGKYAINFTAKIQGTMKVGEDYNQETSKCDPWLVLMVIAQKDDMLIRNAATIAHMTDQDDSDIKENVDIVKKTCKQYFNTEKKQCHGKVDSTLFVEA